MCNRLSYEQYRSFGHGRFFSFCLAYPRLFELSAVIVGIAIACLISFW